MNIRTGAIILLHLIATNTNADEAQNRASLNAAITGIQQQQNADGSWGADKNLQYVTTSSAVDALKASNTYSAEYYAGIAWLENHNANNVDFLSRKITSLFDHGNNLTSYLNNLQSAKRDTNQEGWGLSKNYFSSPIDTALALKALIKTNNSTSQAAAISYLLNSQLTNGSWSSNNSTSSDYWVTAIVHSVLTDIPF